MNDDDNSTKPHMNENNDNNIIFNIQVTSNDKKWIVLRSLENFRYLDKHLHDCIFDRKFSSLQRIEYTDSEVARMNKNQIKKLKQQFATYLNRFCEIAFINSINCGPILNWFEVSVDSHTCAANVLVQKPMFN